MEKFSSIKLVGIQSFPSILGRTITAYKSIFLVYIIYVSTSSKWQLSECAPLRVSAAWALGPRALLAKPISPPRIDIKWHNLNTSQFFHDQFWYLKKQKIPILPIQQSLSAPTWNPSESFGVFCILFIYLFQFSFFGGKEYWFVSSLPQRLWLKKHLSHKAPGLVLDLFISSFNTGGVWPWLFNIGGDVVKR